MLRIGAPAFLLATLSLLLPAPDCFAGSASISVNGEPKTADCISAHGTPRDPHPGDVVKVRDVWIRLDGEFPLDFRTGRKGHFLTKIYAGDPPVLVGLEAEQTHEGNPFEGLSDEEMRGLRGISLEALTPEIAKDLLRIHPDRCCVALRFSDGLPELPPLPAGLRCLVLSEFGKREVDLSGLAALKKLTILDVTWAPEFPLEHLEGLDALRALSVDLGDRRDPAPLGSLAGLRYLDVSGRGPLPPFLARQLGPRREIEDLGFVEKFADLRFLDLEHTWVASLAPLSNHPALEELRSGYTWVSELPSGHLPALRSLELACSEVGATEIDSFRSRHPECRIRWSFVASLREKANAVDRLRIRSGGTCCREEASEKTLFETNERAQVDALIGTLEVHGQASRMASRCSCCGTPTIELYAGEELVAEIGVHHGVALRWEAWPSDIVLTLDSVSRLTGWLSDRGIDGPGKEAARMIGNHAALQRRLERCRKLVPPELWDPLNSSAEEARTALAECVPDPVEQALLCLRLLGCEEGSWNMYAGLDSLLAEDLLPAFDGETLGRAIRRARDAAALNGASRLVLAGREHPEIPREDVDAALPALARHALAHPRLINRRRAMASLAGLGGPVAAQALVEVVAGNTTVRTLPAPEEREPEGMLEFLPLDAELQLEGTDRAFAATMLAKMGYREAASAVAAALADARDEEEKEALETAHEALSRPR